MNDNGAVGSRPAAKEQGEDMNQVHVQAAGTVTYRMQISAENIGRALGYNPQGEIVARVVELLLAGKGVEITTSQYAQRGHDATPFTFLPFVAGSVADGRLPDVESVVRV